jgi:hypothetical protein
MGRAKTEIQKNISKYNFFNFRVVFEGVVNLKLYFANFKF